MTFVYESLEDKPTAVYAMDSASPFQDYSGYNSVATFSGTTIQHPSIVWGTFYSRVYRNTSQAVFTTGLFEKGREQQPFTLEAWVRKTATSSNYQQILGHDSQMDGLCISGTVAHFIVKFTDGTTAQVSYDTQREQVMHLVGTKNESSISLYVDGRLVSSAQLTESQISSQYLVSNGNLYCGYSADANTRAAVAGVALYPSVLSSDRIYQHFWAGNLIAPIESLNYAGYGENINLGWQQYDVFARENWDTNEHFLVNGEAVDVSVKDDALIPNSKLNVSVPGIWKTSFNIAQAGGTSIHGVQVDWDGIGVVVEASVNGTTWTTLKRNNDVSAVTSGIDPTGKELQIAVSFPGGITNDESYLRRLTVTGYKSNVNVENKARVITLASALPGEDFPVRKLHQDWGTQIASGGSVTISVDNSASQEVSRSIEFWIRPTATPTISVTGTMYQNGAANSAALPSNQWTLVHIVPNGNITASTVISGAGQIGSIAYYPTALTAAEVARLYSFYSGTAPLKFAETQPLAVTEPANSAVVYSHDWYVQGAV